MKIRISEHARDLYRTNEPEDVFYGIDVNGTLERIEGKTVEVDTSELYRHQFVILPIEGVCGRETIEDYAVTEVIDDIRAQVKTLKEL